MRLERVHCPWVHSVMGINQDLRHNGAIYHLQTGPVLSTVESQLFCAGRSIHRTLLTRPDFRVECAASVLRRLVRATHRRVARDLLAGRLDQSAIGPRVLIPDPDAVLSRTGLEKLLASPRFIPPTTTTPTPSKGTHTMSPTTSINDLLNDSMDINGAMAVALVDYDNGMCLGQRDNGSFPIEAAAAGNREVVRAKMQVMRDLGIKGDIDDILISLEEEYHLIMPLQGAPMFVYMAIDKKNGNLALTRHKLKQSIGSLKV